MAQRISLSGNRYFWRTAEGTSSASLTFSPDGQRLAFAHNATQGDKQVVVLDGKAQTECDAVLRICFSPDGRRFGVGIKRGAKHLVVVDGHEQEQYDHLLEPPVLFSPDSKRVACGAIRGDKSYMVVDGKEQTSCDVLSEAVFSPDSRRLAYMVNRSKKWFITVDGLEGEKYDLFVKGGRIIVDGPRVFRFIAMRKNEFFRCEVEMLSE